MLRQLHMTSRELLFLHLCSEVQKRKKRQKRDGRPVLCYFNNPMHTAQGMHTLSIIASFSVFTNTKQERLVHLHDHVEFLLLTSLSSINIIHIFTATVVSQDIEVTTS